MNMTCAKCGKVVADYFRYSLCKHVLCIECDLLHDQMTCDAPNYLRKERDAMAKAWDIRESKETQS